MTFCFSDSRRLEICGDGCRSASTLRLLHRHHRRHRRHPHGRATHLRIRRPGLHLCRLLLQKKLDRFKWTIVKRASFFGTVAITLWHWSCVGQNHRHLSGKIKMFFQKNSTFSFDNVSRKKKLRSIVVVVVEMEKNKIKQYDNNRNSNNSSNNSSNNNLNERLSVKYTIFFLSKSLEIVISQERTKRRSKR